MKVPAGAVPDQPRARRLHLLVPLMAAAVIVAAALWAAIIVLRPLPPRTVTMATGPQGGAYQEVGKRYRELLAQNGITLQLLPTAGALENLARLRDPRSRVEIGLLQSGITSGKESPDLDLWHGILRTALVLPPRCPQGPGIGGPTGPQDLDRARGQRHPGARAGAARAARGRPTLRRAARAHARGGRRETGPRRDRRGAHAGFLGLSRGAAATGRGDHRAGELPARGRPRRALPLPDQADGACRRG